ncbi:MAG: DUF2309 domain-containing protein [Vicinamibacteria bacterium]|nr:DUF2309 domain-containing protein [Vicinamibacteria bacterium]
MTDRVNEQFAADLDSAEALRARIDEACESACRAVAPTWPLDQSIAVNPHWGRIERPVREVAARLAVLGGIRVFPPRSLARRAWREGRLREEDLDRALATVKGAGEAGLTAPAAIEALDGTPALPRLPLLIDRLDDDPGRHGRLSWREAITHQVSQTCAAYFDEALAGWQPDRSRGLYDFWRDTLSHDHGIGVLMGVPDVIRHVRALPVTQRGAERWALDRLSLPPSVWPEYLEAVLLTVNGWASWCAYLGFQARLRGRNDAHLRDLLAVRLAWGAMLLECRDEAASHRAFETLKTEWSLMPRLLKEAEEQLLVDEVWQAALEAAYQRGLAGRMVGSRRVRVSKPRDEGTVEAQAVFCIDVRSERFRRALEETASSVETLGFAGFFGIPAAYTPLGTAAPRPQLPGLLAPSVEVTDEFVSVRGHGLPGDGERLREKRTRRFGWTERWKNATRWPASAFSFVEVAGPGYLGPLTAWLRPGLSGRDGIDGTGWSTRDRSVMRPGFAGLGTEGKVTLAARVLHAMGLESRIAPLVLLVGHGSQSANNAQEAALHCGACGGQTGEVNARLLARLLNDAAVREGLRARGVAIPEGTAFVACLHNTTTDEIEVFDLDLGPRDARERLERLRPALEEAGDRVRRERARSLGENPDAPTTELLSRYRRRANDGAQTRPEWGLAGNAAFVIAPRERTRGVDLEGRVFLHDYDAARDGDGSVLELLMTAPMIVTHWINWQYHASTCEPERLGSGNKVLQNVVGGRIGLLEGNGGDLRIGLSKQSVRDENGSVHEPLRLTVLIEAPREAIARIVRRHPVVRQLVENGWLHLWQIQNDTVARFGDGDFEDASHILRTIPSAGPPGVSALPLSARPQRNG